MAIFMPCSANLLPTGNVLFVNSKICIKMKEIIEFEAIFIDISFTNRKRKDGIRRFEISLLSQIMLI